MWSEERTASVDLSELDGDDAVFQEFSPPHSFSLASQVTDTEHETGEVEHDTREVETTLQLPHHLTPFSDSDWMSLPTDAAEHDTRWEVQFWCGVAVGDAGVELRCASVQYPAAVRLLATEVDNPHNWLEAADVLESGDTAVKWYRLLFLFPQQRVEWFESAWRRPQVRVRVRWTRVQLSPRTVTHLTSDLAQVRCVWWLAGVRTVRPTAAWWLLWSEPFGSGALWRMWVDNVSSSSSFSRRALQVGVQLQHVTEEMRHLHLQWSCSLGDESSNNNMNMEKWSHYWWRVAADVKRLSADTLEVQLLIRITRPQ